MNKKLSLEAFKAKNVNIEQAAELEKLSGGVLGMCHPDPRSALEKFIDAIDDAAKNLGK